MCTYHKTSLQALKGFLKNPKWILALFEKKNLEAALSEIHSWVSSIRHVLTDCQWLLIAPPSHLAFRFSLREKKSNTSSIRIKGWQQYFPRLFPRLLKAKLDNSGNYLQPGSVLDFSLRQTKLLYKLIYMLCRQTVWPTSQILESGGGKREGKRTCHWHLTVHNCSRKK